MANEPNPSSGETKGQGSPSQPEREVLIKQPEAPKQAQESNEQKTSTEDSSSPPPPPIAPPVNIVFSPPPQEPPKDRVKWTDIAIVILTLGIVIAAILQTRIFNKQWNEMHSAGEQTDRLICAANQIKSALITANQQNSDAVAKTLAQNQGQFKAILSKMTESNNINRESLESVQRAFVVSHDVTQGRHIITDQEGEHAIWSFTMPWENTGTTPASITSQAFFADKLSGEPTEEQFARKPLIQNAVMGPKAIRNVGNVTATDISLFGHELPHRDQDVIAMPIQTLIQYGGPLQVFWGWVTYRDILPNTQLHVTEFCEYLSSIVIVRDNPQTPFGFGWLPCDHHNCADKQCEDYKAIVELADKPN